MVCTDARLGSETNRKFNDVINRGFIVMQSLKKLKEEERVSAMDDTNWCRLSDEKAIKNIQEIKQNPDDHTDEIYYKERIHDGSSVLGQLMIITYSPSYAVYQRNVRQAQLERAEKMVRLKQVKKQRKKNNDPARFVKATAITQDGEVAQKTLYEMDEEAVSGTMSRKSTS